MRPYPPLEVHPPVRRADSPSSQTRTTVQARTSSSRTAGRSVTSRSEQLYDLVFDPNEAFNLVGDPLARWHAGGDAWETLRLDGRDPGPTPRRGRARARGAELTPLTVPPPTTPRSWCEQSVEGNVNYGRTDGRNVERNVHERKKRGFTLWFTGLSGSGKTTISEVGGGQELRERERHGGGPRRGHGAGPTSPRASPSPGTTAT